MIEIVTHYVIPTGAIYAFGLFSIHIADSVRFVATRLGITNPGQELVNEQLDETQSEKLEQGDHAEDESEIEVMEAMEGGFATMSKILEDMGERQELSDSRMLNLHKYNKSMFSRLSSRLDTTERLFEEFLGPLEEIIQGIRDNSLKATDSIEVGVHYPGEGYSQKENQMEEYEE